MLVGGDANTFRSTDMFSFSDLVLSHVRFLLYCIVTAFLYTGRAGGEDSETRASSESHLGRGIQSIISFLLS